MACQMSETEKLYIIHGVQDGIRNDGRRNEHFRPMVIETGLISHTSGSARVRIGSTDVLVGVKAEIETPSTLKPDEGRVQFFVDCSANATPEFEGRGGDEIAQSISTALTSAYNNNISIPDLKKLCLVQNKFSWVLYVDVVLLECGGNLYDVSSIAVRNQSSLLVGVAGSGAVCLVRQQGKGSVDPDSLNEMIEMGVKVGKELNCALEKKLELEETIDSPVRGFLS